MPVVAYIYLPTSNHPDTCDRMHVANLGLDVVSLAAACACQYFI